jgi:hypothetical protein
MTRRYMTRRYTTPEFPNYGEVVVSATFEFSHPSNLSFNRPGSLVTEGSAKRGTASA